MLKLLHASDFHLDSPFSGLDPERRALRRTELREVPARLAKLARQESVDLVLLPGDLFDRDRVSPEAVKALADALEEMAVPVFIAPGNHDYWHSGCPYTAHSWPDNVHIFTSPALESVDLPELNCVVHGCAFTAPRREDDPVAGFIAPADGRTHLLCLHGEVAEAGIYAPIAPLSIGGSGADYAALGHIHAAASGQENGTLWAYPGCPEGHGFDECGEKGVLLVTIGGGPVTIGIRSADGPSWESGPIETPTAARFVPVCQRQYRLETLDLVDGEPPEDFPSADSPDLVRLLLRGERAEPLDLARLERDWGDRFFHLEVRDQTTLPQDLWARAEENSLTGLFLRGMRERLDAAAEEERPGLVLAARFGLAALEGAEDLLFLERKSRQKEL